MTLSILIVSWNVETDLDECLSSIYASVFDGTLEVIVVDNASKDGTVRMVKEKYPQAIILRNEDNIGFPKANNQALSVATGEYILYLNPDTTVELDTLQKCVAYLRDHKEVGLVGCKVRMLNGKIQYECAREFPTLLSALSEAFYLNVLFPKSRIFGKRLIGYWDHEDSREVSCLLGAFMLGRRSLLNEIGGLDETVFMFLEDVYLCYRVKELGYSVYYLADVSILHKVGRSQKKNSGNLMNFESEAKCGFFEKTQTPKKTLLRWLLLLMEGIFKLIVSILLFPVALIPKIRGKLKNSCIPSVQLSRISWAIRNVKRYCSMLAQ